MFVESLFYVVDRIDPIHHCDQIGACGPSTYQILPSSNKRIESIDNSINSAKLEGIVCNVCEQVVVQVRTQLEDPRVVAYIRKRTNDFCEYLKVVDQEDLCKQTIGKYIDDAIDFIQHLDPLKYCRSIQMCNRNESSIQKSTSLNLPKLGDFINIGIESKSSIEPAVKEEYDGVIEEGMRVPELPVSEVTYQDEDEQVALYQSESHSGCRLCKTFVKEFVKFIPQNKTEHSVKKALDDICKVIYKRGPRQDRCKEFVDAYTRQLVELLIDETSPEMICILLEQCAYENTPVKIIRAPILEETNPDEIAAPSMSEFISSLDPSIKKDSLRTCVECKLFINYLRNAVEDPTSEDKIKDYLKTSLCARIEDARLNSECKALINQYSKTIFKAITEELDPQRACVDLGACKHRKLSSTLIGNEEDESRLPSSLSFQITKELEPKPSTSPVHTKDGVFCDQCVNIVTQIDEYLSAHPIDHDVSTLIDQVCNKLPNEMAKEECTVLVKTFGQDIAQAVTDMQNPRQLCTKISMC